MSRVYFHSEHGSAAIRGSERAYGGGLCSDLLLLSLRISDWESETNISPLRKVVTGYAKTAPIGKFYETMQTWVYGLGESTFTIENGEQISVFSAALNTAWTISNNAIRLLARLHGQCEIHCYVEGQNRAWLADIIDAGLQARIYHEDAGWQSVTTLLREHDDSPVVCSYSVCEGFPNSGVAEWTPADNSDDAHDAWYALDEAERWRLGMAGLRKMGSGLEMTPDTWETFYFNQGTTGFDIARYAQSLDISQSDNPSFVTGG